MKNYNENMSIDSINISILGLHGQYQNQSFLW